MNIQLAYQRLLMQLFEVYDDREATNIADIVLEQVTKQRKIDRILYKDIPITAEQIVELDTITKELLNGKPLQYVLGETIFYGATIKVNNAVLIPRPETEELVAWICNNNIKNVIFEILDIGTGSGCIAVALQKYFVQANVMAVDISTKALAVAKENAEQNNVQIELVEMDILNTKSFIKKFDIIVSNPPYITKGEKQTMHKNVLDFEPHDALFVTNNNPLQFYEAIAIFAQENLAENGKIYLELNEMFANETAKLFKEKGFINTIIKTDFQGKQRMLMASR